MFYVYAYIRSKDGAHGKMGTPYYIGKGKDSRAWDSHGSLPVPNDKTKIILLETHLTEIGAFAIERRLIEWWGRVDLGTGVLYNKTAGGEGGSGRIFSHTEETKQKISETSKGSIPWNKGLSLPPISDEHRKIISETHKGKILSDDTKQKMSDANTPEMRTELSKRMSGENNPFFGKRQPDWVYQKSAEVRKSLIHPMLGKHHTDETKQKMSDAKKGRPPHNKGKKLTDEQKEKMLAKRQHTIMEKENGKTKS